MNDIEIKLENKEPFDKDTLSLEIKIIQLIHLIIFLFIIFAPLSDNKEILFLHVIFIPLLFIHWMTNNNICAITELEMQLRKKINSNPDNSKENCFTCKIIDPVFDLNKSEQNNVIYGTTFALWLWSLNKILLKYEKKEFASFKALAFPWLFTQ